MQNPFTLENKTILVTGASSGIGRACAIILANAGAKLIITGRNKERLEDTKSSLMGEGHVSVIADLTTSDGRMCLLDSVNQLDGVVLNVGINDKSLIKFIKEDYVNKMFQVNFTSNVMLVQALLKGKKLSKGSSIVIMSSVSAFYPSISNAIYGATKAALNQFSKILALEVMPQNIRVNTIEPAFVETDMLKAYALQDNINLIRESLINGRFTTPEEVAYTCQYLLSDATKMITGANIVIDGGFTQK